MKKNIRILGFSMILGLFLVSCTKEIDVLEPTLFGFYKYKSVYVPVPIDLDKDGKANNDLMLEKGAECKWDNTWQYQNGKVILREGKTFCGENSQESDENGVIGSFDYVYDASKKTITLIYEEGSEEVLANVQIGYTSRQKQTFSYELFDEDLQQVVTYIFEAE